MSSLYHHSILSPGRWGINLQEQNHLLHPNWATKTDGLVLSEASQLRARGSISITTTAGASAELLRLFLYITAAGTETIISTTATKILKTVGDLTSAANDITPTGAPTNGFWKFLNFNGKVLAWQASHTPLSYSGSGDFATITVSDGGTLPDGDAAHAAFGRVWAVDDDKQTVRYSGLLDETKWATASGAGSIDMRNVWSQGLDYVTAISSIGANLVIFGRKHIVIYTDGSGSTLGLDPTQMYVVDVVEGTGCVARDTVTAIGEGDLVFLSEVGVQSLRRVIQSKDNPVVTMSWQIQDRIAQAIKTEIAAQASPATDVRGFTGVYIPTTGQYLLIHNNGTVEDVYCFHTEQRTQDERGRELTPITIWDTSVLANFRSAIQTRGGTIYFSGGLGNHIHTYNPAGALDNGIAGIASDYEGGWMSWPDQQLDSLTKLLKFTQVTLANPDEQESAVTFKYATDFNTTLDEITAGENDGDPVQNIYDTMGDTEGQYYKIGIEDSRFGGKSIEKVSMHMKIGRPAFVHSRDGQGNPTSFDTAPSANLQLLVAINPDGTGGGNLQRVATSMTGATWTSRSTQNVAVWRGIAYSPQLARLVIVAANNIETSPDGITWTARTSPGNGGWRAVAWSEKLALFVAVGNSLAQQRVMTSPDGITWTLRSTPAGADTPTWQQVIWCDYLRLFIAAGSASASHIMTSPDGITWTLRTVSSASIDELVVDESRGIIVGNNRSGSDYFISTTGVDWTLISTGVVTGGTAALAYSPDLDQYILTGTGAAVSAPGSVPPLTWSQIASPGIVGFESMIWSSVLSKYIALGAAADIDAVYGSTDGVVWSLLGTLPSTSTWQRVIETEEV